MDRQDSCGQQSLMASRVETHAKTDEEQAGQAFKQKVADIHTQLMRDGGTPWTWRNKQVRTIEVETIFEGLVDLWLEKSDEWEGADAYTDPPEHSFPDPS